MRARRHTAIQWYAEQRRSCGGLGGAARRWCRNRRRAAVAGDGKRDDGDAEADAAAAAMDMALPRRIAL